MNQIYIYSPKSQLFGLLSSNAVMPFTLDGREWSSVTDYVFINFETSDVYKSRVAGKLVRNPYSNAIEIVTEMDKEAFNKALLHGSRLKITQNDALRTQLVKTRGEYIVFQLSDQHEEPQESEFLRELKAMYDTFRYDNDIFFDPVRGAGSVQTLIDVLVGLELNITKFVHDVPFEEAIKYAVRDDNKPHIRVSDVTDLDHLVSDIKRVKGHVIYRDEMNAFKHDLLDEYLNYILKTEYPHIPRDKYALAKAQQRQLELAENKTLKYEQQLFDIYDTDGKIPHDVLAALRDRTPSRDRINAYLGRRFEPLSSQAQIAAAINAKRHTGADYDVPNAYVVTETNPLSPDFPMPIVVNGVSYRTIYHYAYWILFQNIGGVGFDVNVVANIQDLQKSYADHNNNYIITRLTENNERATAAKLNAYPELHQLLLETGTTRLIWGDKNDQVLGIGSGNTGGNRTGDYLMWYRDDMRAKLEAVTPTLMLSGVSMPTPLVVPPLSDYTSLSKSYIYKWYLSSLVEDYANTLKLLTQPSKTDISRIYGKEPVDDGAIQPDESDTFIMNKSGLNKSQMLTIWPFILNDTRRLIGDTHYIRTVIDAFDEREPTDAERVLAEKTLSWIYDHVNEPATNKTTFVASVLSAAPATDMTSTVWYRIHRWARMYDDYGLTFKQVFSRGVPIDEIKAGKPFNKVKPKTISTKYVMLAGVDLDGKFGSTFSALGGYMNTTKGIVYRGTWRVPVQNVPEMDAYLTDLAAESLQHRPTKPAKEGVAPVERVRKPAALMLHIKLFPV